MEENESHYEVCNFNGTSFATSLFTQSTELLPASSFAIPLHAPKPPPLPVNVTKTLYFCCKQGRIQCVFTNNLCHYCQLIFPLTRLSGVHPLCDFVYKYSDGIAILPLGIIVLPISTRGVRLYSTSFRQ